MKNIIILFWTISFITLFSCNKDTNVKMYPESENYRLTKILSFSNPADSIPSRFSELTYSEKGNPERKSFYDYPDILYTYFEYDYENNLLVESRVFDGQVGNLKLGLYRKYEYKEEQIVKEEMYWPGGILRLSEFFEYEGNNLVQKYKVSNTEGKHHHYKYTYNELDLIIIEEVFMYNQELSNSTKYYYDSNSRLIKTEILNFKGTIDKSITYNYNGMNEFPSSEFYYNSNSELTEQRKLIYDDLNNLIETKIIDNQGTNILFQKKYEGELLKEHIQYYPEWGYSIWYVTRYEYEEIK